MSKHKSGKKTKGSQIQINAEFNPSLSKDSKKKPSFRMEPAYSGGLLSLENWDHPVVINCEGIETSQKIPVIYRHCPDPPLGHTTKIEIKNRVDACGVFSMVDQDFNFAVKEVIESGKGDDDESYPWQASIGTDDVLDGDFEFIPEGMKIEVNEQTFYGPFYLVHRCTLREISIVVLGADPNTKVFIEATRKGSQILTGEGTMPVRKYKKTEKKSSVKAKEKTQTRRVRASGDEDETKKNVDAEQDDDNKKDVEAEDADEKKKDVEAEDGDENDGEKKDDVKASRSVVHNHYYNGTPRRRGVTASGERRRDGSDFVDRLPQNERFRSSEAPAHGDIIEASLLLSHGIKAENLEKMGVKKDTIHEAMSPEYRGYSLRQFFVQAMKQEDSGFAGKFSGKIAVNDFQHFIDVAQRQYVKAGYNASRNSIRASSSFSTISIPGVLSNVQHKFLLEGFRNVPSVLDTIASTTNTTDFKDYHLYRLSLDGDFEEVGTAGEVKDVTLKETGYKQSVKTYGLALTYTYQMFRDDDMNAIPKATMGIGRKARQSQNKKGFTLILDMLKDPKFFSEALGNVLKYKLSIDAIAAAVAKFSELKDDTGELMELMQKYLLVPPSLEALALAIQNSREVQISSTNLVGTANPVAGLFETLKSAHFGAAYKGGSNFHSLLLADPAECAIIDAAYLDGQREPMIETFDTDPRTLGIITRAVYHFGVAPMDTRGSVYLQGLEDAPKIAMIDGSGFSPMVASNTPSQTFMNDEVSGSGILPPSATAGEIVA